MAFKFPSHEWTDTYKDAVNENPNYAEAGKDWTHGKVAFVIKADPNIGIESDMAMLLDVDSGQCRQTDFLEADQAREPAAFVIEAGYDRWKAVVSGEVEPIKAMMQGKLKLTKGHFPTIIRYVASSRELVNSATRVPTEFLR